MIKKLLCSAALCLGSLAYSAQQIDLVGPKDVELNSGWTVWTAQLAQPVAVNPFRIVFWITNECQVMPITNISVKYLNSEHWTSAEYKQGYYYTDVKGVVEAIKLDLYQTKVPRERCIVKVSGFL